MKELLNNPGFIALFGTIFGGVGLKVVESWLGRSKERATEQQTMREELRKEIAGLRDELNKADEDEKALKAEVDQWREKYWNLVADKQRVVNELEVVANRLRAYEKALDNSTTS